VKRKRSSLGLSSAEVRGPTVGQRRVDRTPDAAGTPSIEHWPLDSSALLVSRIIGLSAEPAKLARPTLFPSCCRIAPIRAADLRFSARPACGNSLRRAGLPSRGRDRRSFFAIGDPPLLRFLSLQRFRPHCTVRDCRPRTIPLRPFLPRS